MPSKGKSRRNKERLRRRRRRIIEVYDNRCIYTGVLLDSDRDGTLDHVVPKRDLYLQGSRGSGVDYQNLAPCHKTVNKVKSSRSLEDFRKYLLQGHVLIQEAKGQHPRIGGLPYWLREVFKHFGITEDSPFDGLFYFEKQPETFKRVIKERAKGLQIDRYLYPGLYE